MDELNNRQIVKLSFPSWHVQKHAATGIVIRYTTKI